MKPRIEFRPRLHGLLLNPDAKACRVKVAAHPNRHFQKHKASGQTVLFRFLDSTVACWEAIGGLLGTQRQKAPISAKSVKIANRYLLDYRNHKIEPAIFI